MPLLDSFDVGGLKSVRRAACEQLPPVMIVTGPNGAGKSSLLSLIGREARTRVDSRHVLYMPPHRIWQEQELRADLEDGSFMPLAQALNADRSPDRADQALNQVKKVLVHIMRHLNALVLDRFHDKEPLDPAVVIQELYAPLREMISFLFPYLEFIDVASVRGHVPSVAKCWFRRTEVSHDQRFELDELSSGEKAAISVLMPFIEQQLLTRLSALEQNSVWGELVSRPYLLLIDEPELHLHPHLQVRLLEYLRVLTQREAAQFILATHSPTLMGVAGPDELYVLTPPNEDPNYNQLIQLANSAERLAAMRDLCGETYILTSCRDIVCVEGKSPADPDAGATTDVELLRRILPEVRRCELVPFEGKSQVLAAARRLKNLLPAEALSVMSVYALVDADTDLAGTESYVVQWPVAMIENWLLNPVAIWRFLVHVHETFCLRCSTWSQPK